MPARPDIMPSFSPDQVVSPPHFQISRSRLDFILEAAKTIPGLVVEEVPLETSRDAHLAALGAAAATAAIHHATHPGNRSQVLLSNERLTERTGELWFEARETHAVICVSSAGREGLSGQHFPLWGFWREADRLEAQSTTPAPVAAE